MHRRALLRVLLVTRVEIELVARERLEEAFVADPHGTEELVVAVTGAVAFSWGRLTLHELRTLSALLFTVVLEARG